MSGRFDRFKEGDRVIKVRMYERKHPYIPMGVNVTICELDGDGSPLAIFQDGRKAYICDKEFELAEIVNSPLWKALT